MTTHQTFDAMFEDKLNTLMPYLVKTTRGDEDLIQEVAIGIWESMKDEIGRLRNHPQPRRNQEEKGLTASPLTP
jgi:DNA-directed RNA polymerase specialized sigma24 family protein